MKTKSFHLFLILLLFSVLNTNTLSQSIQSKVKNLSEKSDIILEGKVIQKKSDWNQDKTRIFTKVTIQVDEYLKGNNSGKTIVINTPGGEVDGIGELYTHMPSFKDDEDVLVFAKEDKQDKSYRVLDGEEGKLTLYDDIKTGEKVTSFNKKVSALKTEIKGYVGKKSQQ